MHDKKIKELEQKANEIRIAVIEALVEAGSGHTAGPLGMADIFAYLYFHEMRHDPKNPDWPERDRLILSNGHICPVLYATMAYAGYFDSTSSPSATFGHLPLNQGGDIEGVKNGVEKFKKTLRKFGTKFQGHPHRAFMPALETSSGPLGSGLSQAVGMALAERINAGTSYKKWFFCLMSDGELEAGNSWEAAMLAGKEKLGNLIAIIDRNNIQIDGFTEDVMPLEPLADKWRSFGWHTLECDGHNFLDIARAVGEAKAEFGKPSVIIAHTIPGKGVPAFERKFEWHGKPPNKEEGAMALRILNDSGTRC